MTALFLVAPALVVMHIAETVQFGFEEAFQDYTRRIALVQRSFRNPHAFFAVLIGAFVAVWMVTVYLASLGGVWAPVVTIFFGLLLLAEVEHAVRAIAKRGYYSGTVTGILMVLLGIGLIVRAVSALR
jgi:hypothetical protein